MKNQLPHHQPSPHPQTPWKVFLILYESKLGLVLRGFHFTEHNFVTWGSQFVNVLKFILSLLKTVCIYQSLASFFEDKVSQLHTHKPCIFMCRLQPSADRRLQCITCKIAIKTLVFSFEHLVKTCTLKICCDMLTWKNNLSYQKS